MAGQVNIDGGYWPRPALERDEEYGIGHKLRYSSVASLTRSDLLVAAGIIDAYGSLVTGTQERAIRVVRGMKAALEAEGGEKRG